MTYVNERISDEDMDKYRIREMAWGYASNNYRDWVIDRVNNQSTCEMLPGYRGGSQFKKTRC